MMLLGETRHIPSFFKPRRETDGFNAVLQSLSQQ